MPDTDAPELDVEQLEDEPSSRLLLGTVLGIGAGLAGLAWYEHRKAQRIITAPGIAAPATSSLISSLTENDRRILAELVPAFAQKLVLTMADAKADAIDVFLNNGYRPNDAQKALYDAYVLSQKKTLDDGTPNPKYDPHHLPASPPGKSSHNVRQGADLNIRGKAPAKDHKAEYARLGAIGKRHGLVWGGDFSTWDGVHFELPGWRTSTYPAVAGLDELEAC